MIYVFIPYYNEDTPEFKKSLESQTYKDYRIIRRDRKRDKIYWTKAVNDFWRECERWQGTKDDDIICIMNNDIEFVPNFFAYANWYIKDKQIYFPFNSACRVNFGTKEFFEGTANFNTFIGRCFFMKLSAFKESGGFCKLLPHALSDIDFGLRALKNFTFCMTYNIKHDEHGYEPISKWSLRAYNNPILWTIFLLKHPNRYTLLNIAKSWYEIFR